MRRTRASGSDLPNAPLELLHPLALPGGEPAALAALTEAPEEYRAALFTLLRALLAWTRDGTARAPVFDPGVLSRMERELLERGPDPLASPLGLLAGYLARPESAAARDVAWACVCVMEWATEHHAPRTAVLFAQGAALAWPQHPRYAWLAARLLRARGRMREAEAWFRRAHRVAVWSDDAEAQVRAIIGLGVLRMHVGKLPSAKRLHLRAEQIAQRHSLHELHATVLHDLFVVLAEMKEYDDAEITAGRAFTLYGGRNQNLPSLIHDVAQFWNQRGYYWRTAPIFVVLLQHLKDPEKRIRLHAGAARAAAGLGDEPTFDDHCRRLFELLPESRDELATAAAFFEAATAAVVVHRWEMAARLVGVARRHARRFGASDIVVRADLLSRDIAARTTTTITAAPVRRTLDTRTRGDVLADEFTRTLAEA